MAVLRPRHRTLRVGIVFVFGVLLSSFGIEPFSESSPLGTQQGTPPIQWQPNQAPVEGHYVGTKKCVECHTNMAGQISSPMGKALEIADSCQVLITHRLLTFRQGRYSYRLVRDKNRSLYQVSEGQSSVSIPILYCFGQGEAGQTYVFEHNGSFYESRLSFYKAIGGLDITLGHKRDVPSSLDEAIGNRMSAADARSCFGCHSTAAANKSQLKLDRLVPGVACESCHGPGGEHLAAMTSGNIKEKKIINPSGWDAEAMSNFCGSCHRTWEDVVEMILNRRRNNQELGINSIRFQPYRIANSPCYDLEDRRISCTACHDPHKSVEHNPTYYDSKCTACHTQDVGSSKQSKVKVCPVGKQKCTTCHMPKYDLPGSHFKFTDHHIRVVRTNESVW